MTAFSPAPTLRSASARERIALALDRPFSFDRAFTENFQQGILDSFGLGTAIRTLTTPPLVNPATSGLTMPTPETRQPSPFDAVVGARAGLGALALPGTGVPSKVLSEDEYKASPYFRDVVPWEPGMTEARAQALSSFADLRAVRQFFSQKQPIASFLGNFAGQFLDPINFVPVFGPAAHAATIARAGQVFGRVLLGAGEAAVNTAAFGLLTADVRRKMGDDVSFETMALEIGMSALIGGAFGGGVGIVAGRNAGVLARETARMNRANDSWDTFARRMDTTAVQTGARIALNDAASSLAIDGEVKMTPNGIAPTQRVMDAVQERVQTARADAEASAAVTGTKAGEVVISPSGRRVAVRPEIVDIRSLVHAAGDLQVRDRSTAASAAWVAETAAQLDPLKLMPNIDASQGAPLVGPDDVIDSGNGRIMAIKAAIEGHPERYDAYKQHLRDAGYEVPGEGLPVLIQRRLTDQSPEARSAFNAEVNLPNIARMSPVEIAAMDRKALLTGSVLDALQSGPVTSAANRPFADAFLFALPKNERGALVDPTGTGLNSDGVRRIENALIAAAYGDVDPSVIRRFAEATDDNTRSIVGAMADTAGKWAKMRRAVQRGDIGPEYDITAELTTALRLVSRWRDEAAAEGLATSKAIREGMQQIDLMSGEVPPETKYLIRAFYNNDHFARAVGRDVLAGRLDSLVESAFELGRPQLFGGDDAPLPTKMEVLQHGVPLETDLFAAPDDVARIQALGGQGEGQPAAAPGGGDRQDAAAVGQEGAAAALFPAARPVIREPQDVRDLMRQRFIAGGRPDDEATAAATLVEKFYTSTAARAGMSVPELVAQFPLPEVLRGGVLTEDALAQPGSPAFARWFGDSKVVDKNGKPLVVYHGSARSDRIHGAGKFDRRRATSGPMAFFTDDPELASSYATKKSDTSLPDEERIAQRFLVKPPGYRGKPAPIDRMWWALPMDERQRIASLASRVMQDDEGNVILGPEGQRDGIGNYDFEIKQARGNHLAALSESWLNSGAIFNEEDKFLDVLRLAGMTSPVEYVDPFLSAPGVVPVYLSISNPLDTSAIPANVIAALEQAAKGRRAPRYSTGKDMWDKTVQHPKSWLERLRNDAKDGTTHAWTSIPDWVTDALRALGYDGIKDVSGKGGGEQHAVWIPFDESQVKSVFNRGTFDPNDPRILYQGDKLETEPGAEGLPQTLIPGVKPVTDADRMGLRADRPMRGGNAAPPAGGLFDLDVRNQPDLFAQAVKQATPEEIKKAQQLTLFQPAYHGSPHIFEQFSTEKIGTGEGAQAYGYGLYFASKKQVAQHYREALAGKSAPHEWINSYVSQFRLGIGGLDPNDVSGASVRFDLDRQDDPTTQIILDSPGAIEAIVEVVRGLNPDGSVTDAGLRAYRRLDDLLPKPNPGRLFKVEVPEDDELMNWDATLSEQPEKVKAALNKEGFGEYDDPTGREIYEHLERQTGGPKQTSDYLRSIGIPGHRYIGHESQSTNYVIYDDSRINVLEFEQPAYHVSPHRFSRFELSDRTIGTGEGVQAFGHGLYFMQSEDVRDAYKAQFSEDGLAFPDGTSMRVKTVGDVDAAAAKITDLLEARGVTVNESIVWQGLHDGTSGADPLKAAVKALQDALPAAEEAADLLDRGVAYADPRAKKELNDIKAAIAGLESLDGVVTPAKATVYRVDLPDDEELLNWDAAFQAQPERVKAALTSLIGAMEQRFPDGQTAKIRSAGGYIRPQVTGEEIYGAFRRDLRGEHGWLTHSEAQAAASAALREAGIPGHKYFDGLSRVKGKGTHNIVIYDDARINVLDYEQPGALGPRGSIKFGNDGPIISLFERADASTALHETGHHFLHMLKSMAEGERAPAAIKADWDAVKRWWSENAADVAKDSPIEGVTDTDVRAVLETGTSGDVAKDLAINIGLQEQWARGFEAYLRDGQAPTESLRDIFRQFKAWLTAIYRKVKDLNVNLTPEIRRVFDNMLTPAERGEMPTLDTSPPRPDPVPDGMAEAAARVGKSEQMRELAAQHGVDLATGDYAERADIERMRNDGRLTEEDEAALKEAEDAFVAAEAYSNSLKIAASCMT